MNVDTFPGTDSRQSDFGWKHWNLTINDERAKHQPNEVSARPYKASCSGKLQSETPAGAEVRDLFVSTESWHKAL